MVDEIRYKIEGIKHFFKYYRLIYIFSKQNSSYDNFEQYSQIEVIKSYD